MKIRYVCRFIEPYFLGGPCKIPLTENHGPWKPYLASSFDNQSFLLKDREPEYEYFYTKQEREQVSKQPKFVQSQQHISKPQGFYHH